MIKFVEERIYHFSCMKCFEWWSIADQPEENFKPKLTCPFCEKKQKVKRVEYI